MKIEFKYVLYFIMLLIGFDAIVALIGGNIFWGIVGIISLFGIYMMTVNVGTGYILYLLSIVLNIILTILSFNIIALINVLLIPLVVTFIAFKSEDTLGSIAKLKALLGK